MQRRIESASAMEALGHEASAAARCGAVFALMGDLGAGKTHWTKGFVAGLGSAAEVTSPTFGLVHEYHGGRLPVLHLDFYRLKSADELISLGWDELLDQSSIVIAEWADRFPEMLPDDAHWLRFMVEPDGSRTVDDSPTR